MSVEQRLKEMGIVLPSPKPVGAYLPAVAVDKYVYTAGQVPLWEGALKYQGRLGESLTIEQGKEAAKICAINALAAIRTVASLDDVERIVKLQGFINCTDDFLEQAAVLNGASEFLIEVFGERGKHARAAMGVNVLWHMAPVELDIIAKLK
jgi:enamine deaminase RidA (YjgF/YER057c/UK114 family)